MKTEIDFDNKIIKLKDDVSADYMFSGDTGTGRPMVVN